MKGWLTLGSAVLAFVWFALPALSLPPFTAHMIMHMAVVAVASPAIAWGLRRSLGRIPRSAIALSMVELVLVWAWHLPTLHHFARHTLVGVILEQACFLFAGVALWWAALGGSSERRRARCAEGIAGLLLTSMHMTLLGALLTLASTDLYGHSHVLHSSAGGLSAAHDQQLGGAIMLVVGGLAYLAGALGLAADALSHREPHRNSHREPRRARIGEHIA